MLAYASRTGTRRNLDALHAAGWRQFLAPGQRPTRARGWALDNGAWSLYRAGRAWDAAAEAAFLGHLTLWGRSADFVVAPDIVAGGLASLDLSLRWLAACMFACRRVLVAVQDGMTATDLSAAPLGARVGIFVGGTTTWKEQSISTWAELARRRGCWLHVGRVNTARRIDICRLGGASSFDGTSATRYSSTLPLLDGARRQGVLLRPVAVEHGRLFAGGAA